MKFNLKRFFPFLYRTQWVTQPGHETEFAFESGGVEYFCFSDNFNAYYERYMAAMDAINALEQRVTREYLERHTALVDEYVNAGKLSLIAVVNHNLKERMSHISNVELLYQLASVWYFSKEENCYTWNPEIAERKIAQWKKDKEVLSFFLKSPLKRYMPLPDSFSETLLTQYTKGQNLQELSTIKYHLLQITETPKNKDLRSILLSRIAQLKSLLTQVNAQ